MSFVAALWEALSVARREGHALDAAIAAGKAGASPLGILRTFSAASGGALEQSVTDELEAGLRVAVKALHDVTGVAAAVLSDAPTVHGYVDTAVDVLLSVGYQASGLRATLQTWLDE